MEINELYMQRALQLASMGEGRVSPNPMVGAVIVCDDKIIGEGYHRRWGDAHAEVNAVASVRDRCLLKKSTMYVTLEPCSHYGKTPPCAELVINCGIPRVVIGTLDPFEKVRGRGVEMLRQAGVEVVSGVLDDECKTLNKRFITAHTKRRPYVLLKWAESIDGFVSGENGEPVAFSNELSKMWMHRERSRYDAIMVGTNTVLTDNPKLTVREWPGRNPRCVTFDIHGRLSENSHVLQKPDTIVIKEELLLNDLLSKLYSEYGITSLMVEGGSKLLNSFLKSGCYDEFRIEVAPILIGSGIKSPCVECEKILSERVRTNEIWQKRS